MIFTILRAATGRSSYPCGMRKYKGYLVNMKYVERYSRTEVQMKNGKRLLISKYKYQDFIKAYLEYITEDSR